MKLAAIFLCVILVAELNIALGKLNISDVCCGVMAFTI